MTTATLSPTYSRKTVYLSNATINTVERRAKIHNKSFSKTLDEFVFENSTSGPKNNLSQWIAKDMSDEDFDQIQKNIKISRVTTDHREKELLAILES